LFTLSFVAGGNHSLGRKKEKGASCKPAPVDRHYLTNLKSSGYTTNPLLNCAITTTQVPSGAVLSGFQLNRQEVEVEVEEMVWRFELPATFSRLNGTLGTPLEQLIPS